MRRLFPSRADIFFTPQVAPILMSKDKKTTSSFMQQFNENLRKVYEQEDDVPDRFQQLLQQLKEKENEKDRDARND